MLVRSDAIQKFAKSGCDCCDAATDFCGAAPKVVSTFTGENLPD
jgi:hypothetical protein